VCEYSTCRKWSTYDFIAPSEQIIVGPKPRFGGDEQIVRCSEEESLENLKLIGNSSHENSYFASLQEPIRYETVSAEPVVKIEEPVIAPSNKKPQEGSNKKKKSSSSKKFKGVDMDDYSDSGSQISIDERWDSYSEYDDEDGHYMILSRGDQNVDQLEVVYDDQEAILNDENFVPTEDNSVRVVDPNAYHYDYFGSSPQVNNPNTEQISPKNYYDGFDPFFQNTPEESVDEDRTGEPEEIGKLRDLVESGFMTWAEFKRRKQLATSK